MVVGEEQEQPRGAEGAGEAGEAAIAGRAGDVAETGGFLSERVRRLIDLDRALLEVGIPGVLERPPAELAALEEHLLRIAQRREWSALALGNGNQWTAAPRESSGRHRGHSGWAGGAESRADAGETDDAPEARNVSGAPIATTATRTPDGVRRGSRARFTLIRGGRSD